MKARLLRFKDLNPTVRHFDFETETPIDFQPGQFVSLKGLFDGKEIIRPYSIASAPQGNQFSLCLNRVEGGIFSPHLFELTPGAEVEFGPPLGYFTLRHSGRDALLVATGTGIAPFRSMLYGHLPTAGRIDLLFGARHEHGLVYAAEFKALEEQYGGFRFYPTITRPEREWQGRSGRVQTHLVELIDGRRDLDIYLCGLKEMVDDVRTRLKQMGFDRKQIIYEKYD